MTASVNTKISQISSMVDESFNTARGQQYKLHLQISAGSLLLAVNEQQKNRFIAFERYSLQNSYSLAHAAAAIPELAQSNQLLTTAYDQVHCLVVNNHSTLVPEALYDADRKKTYLRLNAELEGDEYISSDEIPNLDARNVFAFPVALKAKLDQLFSKVSYHHFSTPLIEQLIRQSKNQSTKKVFVHVQSAHFELVVTEGKKLLFYNTFNHHTAEDFIYYLLFAMEQLQLNPEQAEVLMIGEIEKSSSIYLLAQKYIRNLSFGKRENSADYSYQLQSIPDYFYFTLFNTIF